MIVIDPHATFDAPVSVNKKGFIAQFGMSFKLLGQDALDALMKRWLPPSDTVPKPSLDDQPIAVPAPQLMTDQQFIEEVATGWREVSDMNGELAFSKENLARLCQLPGVRVAIISAFMDGYSEAAEKNLPAQPAI